MRIIIDNKLYDTESAEKLLTLTEPMHFGDYEETLYRKKTANFSCIPLTLSSRILIMLIIMPQHCPTIYNVILKKDLKTFYLSKNLSLSNGLNAILALMSILKFLANPKNNFYT